MRDRPKGIIRRPPTIFLATDRPKGIIRRLTFSRIFYYLRIILCIGTTKGSRVEIFYFLTVVLFACPVDNFYACVFFAHPVDIFVRMADRPRGIFRRPPIRTCGGQAKRNISTPYIFYKFSIYSYLQKFEPQNYSL